MDRLQPKLIKPESILIEETALALAAAFWEVGKSQGLPTKHKTAQSYAKAYVKQFIPKAVDYLMDILSQPHTPQFMKDAIYDAFMERTNDTDLSNIGLKVFENPLAASFVSDKVIPQKPLIANSPKKKHKGRIEDLPLDYLLAQATEKVKLNG